MGLQENITQSNTQFVSYWPALKGIVSLALGTKIADSVLNPKTAYCGEAPDTTVPLMFAAGLGIYGCWQLWQAFVHRVVWTEDTLYVRDRVGKTHQVKFMDLTNIRYDLNGTRIYVFGDISLKIHDWVSGRKELDQKFETIIPIYAPHLAYSFSWEDGVKSTDTAGCLECRNIFRPSAVTSWVKQELKMSGLDPYSAVCPCCGVHGSIVLGRNGIVVTQDGLANWTAALNATFEAWDEEFWFKIRSWMGSSDGPRLYR